MTGILLVGGVTLLCSFFCSLFEAVLYSIPRARLEGMLERGLRGAQRLARMREDIEAPIAAILTVNTIAHTAGAAWCGAMVGQELGSAAVGVFAAIFTVLVLSLTEIVPKSLGVRFASELGPLIAWPLQIMIWSVWPVVWIAQRSMRVLTGGSKAAGPSEDEVVLFARLAAKLGSVRSEERRWVENALRLDRVTAGDLRTPRTVVETRAADTLVRDVAARGGEWIHSRIPVTEGADTDRVLGLVYRREVLGAALEQPGDLALRDLMRPIQFVPETMKAHDLLALFLRERKHLVAVVDEYGGFDGVVTLEDVLECLLGEEIVDEHDEVVDMQRLAKRRSPFRKEDAETPAGD